jgi:hypothetical protein
MNNSINGGLTVAAIALPTLSKRCLRRASPTHFHKQKAIAHLPTKCAIAVSTFPSGSPFSLQNVRSPLDLS